ncbi:MAG: winged helix-turn-helix domain-containing protein [Sphingopyxis sp.]|nr:winged helix-turn-helix domain-containing protein [Sphingopyxis sp.]
MMSDGATPPIDLAGCADLTIGGLVVRPSLREIEAGGTVETLEPRVMQVLVLLAEMEGRTVSRDLMVERCWGGVIVGEDAIQRCIGRLRKVAEATNAFEIVTLSRVGYRMNARIDAATPVPPERLLAVLPFDNLSNDPDFDYFADGVSEEILHLIARGSSIRVIGRTSSFQYRGSDKNIARIAQELGATHVLDGSVRRSGDALRVAAHLMELSDQTMLWADRFDGDTANPFDLQDAVARAAVQALNGALKPVADAKPVSAEGFDALLRLRQLLSGTSFGGEDETVIAAVESLTPDSAEAWGTIAKVRASQRWTAPPMREVALRAAAHFAAQRALALDPNNGSAHKALFMLEPPAGRFLAREEQLERAYAARPEDGELLWSLYLHYLSVGRLALSAQMAEEAYRVDPLRPLNVIAYANSLYTSGLPTQSLALMHHAVDRWPSDPTVFAITIWTAAVQGEHDFVRALMSGDWRSRYQEHSQILTDRAVFVVEGLLRAPDKLLAASLKRLEVSIELGETAVSLVGLCAYLGADLDDLYDLVDKMPVEKLLAPDALLPPLDGLSHLFLRVNARLRESPRFVDLCRRLGLIDYWRQTGNWPDCVGDVAQHYDFLGQCGTLACGRFRS